MTATKKIEAVDQLNNSFGNGTVMRLGDEPPIEIEAISTGAPNLDHILGVGGIPRGRIVEIFGPASSGKTTLLYHIMAEAQKKGGTCAFIDTEHALDPPYAQRVGVDTDDLYICQPDYGEQALEVADQLVRSGEFMVVCIDSVAGLVTKAELDGEMGDQSVGGIPRLMSKAMRKLAGNVNKTNTACIFTNQIREKIGVMFGSPETQPGGRALPFHASQRLDIRRIETLKEGDLAVGIRSRVKAVKNKVAPPFREAEFNIYYGKGISWEASLLDLGEASGVVGKTKNGHYSYGETRLGHGLNQAVAFLKENPKLAKAIQDGEVA